MLVTTPKSAEYGDLSNAIFLFVFNISVEILLPISLTNRQPPIRVGVFFLFSFSFV